MTGGVTGAEDDSGVACARTSKPVDAEFVEIVDVKGENRESPRKPETVSGKSSRTGLEKRSPLVSVGPFREIRDGPKHRIGHSCWRAWVTRGKRAVPPEGRG